MQPRGMQRLSQFGLPGGRPSKGSDKANDFLTKAAQARANKHASGSAKSDAPLTKGQERRLKLQKFVNMSRGAAKSAAHQGVVARPMDAQLSNILEQRRAQVLGRGTSLARIKRHGDDENELVEEAASEGFQEILGGKDAERGTSVARTGNVDLPLVRIPRSGKAPASDEPSDMEI